MSLKWQEHNWLGGLEALPERKQDLQSPSLISDVQDIILLAQGAGTQDGFKNSENTFKKF